MAKAGTACRVCRHRERAAIDLAVARGVSVTALSRRYGVSTDSIYRHAKAHLPAQLRAQLVAGPAVEIDLDHLRETESQSLLANLVTLRQRLFAGLDVAEEAGDANMVSRIASQLHRNFELVGRLLGDLAVGSMSTTNVFLLPTYVDLRVGLINALSPFPEARQAVAQVLHQLEDRAAKQVEADAAKGLAS